MGSRAFQSRPAGPTAKLKPTAQTASLKPRLAIAATHGRAEREAEGLTNTVLYGAGVSALAPHSELNPSTSPASTERPFAPPAVHEVLASPGHPLDRDTRNFFEPRFRHDFGSVRIHTDGHAAASAAVVGADAYSVGPNIAFAAGRYRPREDAGRRLIAHELSHVSRHAAQSNVLFRQTSTPTSWFGGPRTPKKQLADDDSHKDFYIKDGIAVEKPPAYTVIKLGNKEMNIRFAFASSEYTSSTGTNYVWTPSSLITNAKAQIANGFAEVVKNFGNYNYTDAADKAAKELREKRLSAMFLNFDSSHPLDIFLSVNPQDQTALSSAIKVDANKAATSPAMLIPTQIFTLARLAGGKLAPQADADEVKRTMLHETTHNQLIRSGADFAGAWRAHNQKLVPLAPNNADLANMFLTLARFFIIAQEEVFVYKTEEELYPAGSSAGGSRAMSGTPMRGAYERFITIVTNYFVTRKGLKLEDVTLKVMGASQAAGAHNWTITYKFPVGAAALHEKPKGAASSGKAGQSAPPSAGSPTLMPPTTAPSDDRAIMEVIMLLWSTIHPAAKE